MRAAAINAFGGASKLHIAEMPVPSVAAGQVLIRVRAAGVGSWDASARTGDVETERDFPLVLGTDGAGIVADVGRSAARRFRRGDRVWAYEFDNPKGGFYAEFVAVSARSAAHVPRTLDLRRAGALTVIGLTALQGVDDALRLKRGETVIVHGASGNVGMIAVQFAKWRGARVLATASGKRGVSFVRRLGISNVIDGKRGDIEGAARTLAPDGVDAVLAFAGGDGLTRCLDALRRNGRVAYPNGVEPAPRHRTRVRMKSYDAVASPQKFAALSRAVIASGLRVPIAKAYTLERAAAAHRLVEAGHLLGKVILTM